MYNAQIVSDLEFMGMKWYREINIIYTSETGEVRIIYTRRLRENT